MHGSKRLSIIPRGFHSLILINEILVFILVLSLHSWMLLVFLLLFNLGKPSYRFATSRPQEFLSERNEESMWRAVLIKWPEIVLLQKFEREVTIKSLEHFAANKLLSQNLRIVGWYFFFFLVISLKNLSLSSSFPLSCSFPDPDVEMYTAYTKT